VAKDHFPQTLKTWIHQKLEEGHRGREELNRYVMGIYSGPLQVYCRGTGSFHLGEPDDIVSGFFADRLSRNDYFEGWKESGLRLRRWLMNGLGFYLKEQAREQRHAGASSRNETEMEASTPDNTAEVEADMDRAFAVSVVRLALAETQKTCDTKGLREHWRIFHKHYYDGLPYAEFTQEFGVGAARAAEMARTVAGKFRSALRGILASDGARESEIDTEIETLLELSA